MTIKVTYNVTDIYVSESVSSTYINVSYEAPSGGGGAVWGDIIGTLSDQADLQAALDAKVPYNGATANVDLGEYELKAGQIELDQTPTGVAGVAVTRWNDSTGTIETTLKGGSVVLEHGRDMFERVVNKTGIQLTKAAYQAVRVSNAQGQRLAVQLAQANNDNNSADTIGLVVETIDNNQEGYIYTVGEIDGVNTTGTLQGETWVDGDVLYLSPTTAGRITNVKPVAPQHLVIIGYVIYAHQNNGKIYVKVMNGWELGELHDVDTTGATNGQVLKYNGTIWTPSGDVGITSLNGLTATTQTFSVDDIGTNVNIDSVGTNHKFNFPSASATNRGVLTSADWTTFNNKQNALTNPITGTGVSGQVAYWSGTNTQTGSNNLFWDNTNGRLGVGTNAPAAPLDVRTTSGFDSAILKSQYTATVYIGNDNTWGYFGTVTGGAGTHIGISSANNSIRFRINGIEAGLINANRNLILQNGGTFIDSGQRLQVTGDTLLKGSGNTSATTALTVQNSSSVNLLRVLNDGQTILRGTTNNDTTTIFRIEQANQNGRFLVNATGQVQIVGDLYALSENFLSLIRNSFNPTSGSTTHTSLFISPTINQTGGANGITRGLYVNPSLTAAADWRSIEWSNNTGWGLYGVGTSNNFLNGNLGIGVTPTQLLHVAKNQNASTQILVANSNVISTDSRATFQATSGAVSARLDTIGATGTYLGAYIGTITNHNLYFWTNGQERGFFTATGNLILGNIGTSDTTEKLQVNGTMKVSGASTFSSSVTSTQFRLSALNTAPATSSSTGTLGEIRIDADYIYICTATNTWKRVAIATW